MRVAILADIHGNLPACEAVLEDIARVAPDYIVAAGDLALRGAHPRETVELLFDRCNAVIMGNTDCYLAGHYLGGAYRERDHWKTELLQWTRDQLGDSWLQRLGAMPFSVRYSPRRGQDLFVCHANPRNLEDSLDPTLDENTVRRYFQNLDAAACAFGHLHSACDQQIRLLGNAPLKNLAKHCSAKRIKPWLQPDAPRHLAPFRIHAKPGRLSSHG